MRYRFLAAILCLSTCALAKADPILAGSCATTPALCADTPSASGSLQLFALDFRGESVGSYQSGPVTSATQTFTDPNGYYGSSSATINVGSDGIHGSSTVSPTGVGEDEASFQGQITDYFAVSGNVPKGAQLEFTYGADILSDASLGGNYSSYYSAYLSLDSSSCIADLYDSGDLTKDCTAFVPINPADNTAVATLNFSTLLFSGWDGGPTLGSTTYLDATNTAKIDAVTVVDSMGNPISGLQVYDASGYNYNAVPNASPTPEPSGLLLLGTGLLGLAGLRRRTFCAERRAS